MEGLCGSLIVCDRTSSLMPPVPSVFLLSLVTKSSGLPPTIPSVSERTVPPTNLSRPSLTSVLPPTSMFGVQPMVTKPQPPTSSLLNRRPLPPSSPFPVRTFLTSRDRRLRGHPRADTLSTKKRVKTSRSSVPEVRLPSPSRPLRNSRRRVSRPGLSPFPRGRSSIGRKKATS